MEALISMLKSIAYISPELEARLREILEYVEFPKNTTILKIGQVCRHITFLESGLIRIFQMKDIREITTWLLKENDIFIAPLTFFKQDPSVEGIMTLEPCRGWRITFQQLNELCANHPEFLWHFRHIQTEYYERNQTLRNDLLGKDGLEKYTLLMEKYPELLRRVDLKYLYSYVNLSKPAFERARDEYKEKKGWS